MKKILYLFLLVLFVLPGCEKNKPEIVAPKPTSPPVPEEMQPTFPPPIFN